MFWTFAGEALGYLVCGVSRDKALAGGQLQQLSSDFDPFAGRILRLSVEFRAGVCRKEKVDQCDEEIKRLSREGNHDDTLMVVVVLIMNHLGKFDAGLERQLNVKNNRRRLCNSLCAS